jgi:hypothetical protein
MYIQTEPNGVIEAPRAKIDSFGFEQSRQILDKYEKKYGGTLQETSFLESTAGMETESLPPF